MLGENAIMGMASTPPTGPSGIQGILTNPLPDGKLICKTVDFDFNCPACRKRLVTEPGHMCMHRMYLRPPTQNQRSIDIARAAYGQDSDAFRREMMGTAIVHSLNFIPADAIAWLRSPAAVKEVETEGRVPPRFVYISVDPSGSSRARKDGHVSDYAIVSAYMRRGGVFVVILYFINKYYVFLAGKNGKNIARSK